MGVAIGCPCAYELSDTAVTRELLVLLDSHQPGDLAPMLRAERGLVRSRLAAQDDDQAAAASFVSAISSLRRLSPPYHLAHGLLDQAEHLIRLGDADAAALAISEAAISVAACDVSRYSTEQQP